MRIYLTARLKPYEVRGSSSNDLKRGYFIHLQLDDHVISCVDPDNGLYQRALAIELAMREISPNGWIELDEFACVLLKDYLDRLEFEAKEGSLDKALRILAAIVLNYTTSFKNLDLISGVIEDEYTETKENGGKWCR